MNTIKLAGLGILSFVTAACAVQPTTPGVELTFAAADQAELANAGISSVTREGMTYTFVDLAGDRLGAMRVDRNTVETSLASHHLVTTSTSDALALECDGHGISLAKGEAGPGSVIDAVAGCAAAVKVQGVLLRTVAPTTERASTTALVQEVGCTALGSNQYCDGSTLVYSLDAICYDAAGIERIETKTYYLLDSWPCR